MEAIEAILKRRSIRKYTSEPVSESTVKILLDAGMHAPSAKNLQPWQFIVLDDREVLDKLAIVHPYAKMLGQATLAILVCGDRNIQEIDGYLVQDCAAVTQNIMLAAHACGLGSVWLGLFPREERIADVSNLFKLPGHILPVSLISIGYPDESKDAPDRWKADRVHYNKY